MQRVAIFGSPGSGKSTLARRLSALTGLPVVHLDQHYFDAGWVRKPTAAFEARMNAIVETDRWITDGNYTKTVAQRLARADTLILLDCPRWLCMGRVLRRIIRHYGQVRADQADGCAERFDPEFLTYVWTFPAKAERIRPMLRALAGQKTVLILKNRQEVARFLETVGSETAPATGHA